jgi:hypothetical protein
MPIALLLHMFVHSIAGWEQSTCPHPRRPTFASVRRLVEIATGCVIIFYPLLALYFYPRHDMTLYLADLQVFGGSWGQ